MKCDLLQGNDVGAGAFYYPDSPLAPQPLTLLKVAVQAPPIYGGAFFVGWHE